MLCYVKETADQAKRKSVWMRMREKLFKENVQLCFVDSSSVPGAITLVLRNAPAITVTRCSPEDNQFCMFFVAFLI